MQSRTAQSLLFCVELRGFEGEQVISMELSREAVLAALNKVTDSGTGLDLVSLNFVRNLTIKGGTVRFDMVVNTPASPSKVLLRDAARGALIALPGVDGVDIQLETDIPRRGGDEGKQSVPCVSIIVSVSSRKGGGG